MTLEFSVAKENLQGLVREYSPFGELSNEAQTRFSFIDSFLELCLDWPKNEIVVERHEDGGRTDYECGKPRRLVVEAKKSSSPLRFPPTVKRNRNRASLASLIQFDDVAAMALRQVLLYGQSRGVQAVVLTNGPQLVAFLATRTDGIAPLDGDALVFDGYEEIVNRFSTIYETLSRSGLQEERLAALLLTEAPANLPQKLSSACMDYYKYKYANQFQESLKNSASIVIEDIGRTSEVESAFLDACYCESGPLTQYSLLSKSILNARYAALFPSNVAGSRIAEVNPRGGGSKAFSEQVLQEALARRPIVLIGDVGVGKTTFLRNLVRNSETSAKTLYVAFDLGYRGSLTESVREAFLDEVEKTLSDELQVNLMGIDLIERILKPYFDWRASRSHSSASFERVRKNLLQLGFSQ